MPWLGKDMQPKYISPCQDMIMAGNHSTPIQCPRPFRCQVCNATTGTLLCEERPRYGHGEDDFGESLRFAFASNSAASDLSQSHLRLPVGFCSKLLFNLINLLFLYSAVLSTVFPCPPPKTAPGLVTSCSLLASGAAATLVWKILPVSKATCWAPWRPPMPATGTMWRWPGSRCLAGIMAGQAGWSQKEGKKHEWRKYGFITQFVKS